MKVALNEKLAQKLVKSVSENKNKVKVMNETNFNIPNYVKKSVDFTEQLGDTFVKKATK